LSRRANLRSAAATLLVDRLEKAGFVTRNRSSTDRRRVEVRAVPGRIKAVDALYQAQYRRMTHLLAKYSEEEFAAIIDFIEQTTAVLAEETERNYANEAVLQGP
jgi:DNA-binding MarR family transcriptional regulator